MEQGTKHASLFVLYRASYRSCVRRDLLAGDDFNSFIHRSFKRKKVFFRILMKCIFEIVEFKRTKKFGFFPAFFRFFCFQTTGISSGNFSQSNIIARQKGSFDSLSNFIGRPIRRRVLLYARQKGSDSLCVNFHLWKMFAKLVNFRRKKTGRKN